jgi:MFS family permease
VAGTSLVLLIVACILLNVLALYGGVAGLVFVALLIFGTGLGAGTLAGAIAALSNVSEGHAGVASGVSSAAFQVGGALGIAIISAVAAIGTGARTTPAALTEGYRLGFAAAAAIALLGLVAAVILLRERRRPDIAAGDAEPARQAVGQR